MYSTNATSTDLSIFNPGECFIIFIFLALQEAYKAKYGIGHFPTENWSLERYQLRHSVSKELGNHARLAQRCGWLDIVALKYSCQINGFSSLYLSRLDVLSDLDKIQLGVSYKHYDGTPIQSFPADLDLLKQLKVNFPLFRFHSIIKIVIKIA